MMRYRVRLENTETKERQMTAWGFTNKKEALEWAEKWRGLGKPFECTIIDTKKKEAL